MKASKFFGKVRRHNVMRYFTGAGKVNGQGRQYIPQGARECARRVRQMSGDKLPSVPRRMWCMDIDWFGKTYISSKRITLARTLFAKESSALKPQPVVLR